MIVNLNGVLARILKISVTFGYSIIPLLMVETTL